MKDYYACFTNPGEIDISAFKTQIMLNEKMREVAKFIVRLREEYNLPDNKETTEALIKMWQFGAHSALAIYEEMTEREKN